MKRHRSLLLLAAASVFLAAGFSASGADAEAGSKKAQSKAQPKVYPTFGTIERLDPALDALIAPGAVIEKLVGGLEWAEGPVWNRKTQTLLFSDVPRNVIFEWREGVGTRDYLFPSGYTGRTPRGGSPGSNGLTLDAEGRLVICMHGDRLIGRLEKANAFTVLAEYYRGRRFNSPNDLVYRSNGDLYFTDPPYGLEKGNQDPTQELLFSGVYLLRRGGDVVLLTRDLAFPNGVALSPDEKTLYVAVSDPARPVIMAYAVKADGTLGEGRVFFDAAPLAAGRQGLPDGLKVDVKGNVFATGPGGVLVLSPEGRHLGTINPGLTTANCAWGDSGSTLYLTANTHLCRVRTLTKGRLP
ncbi:MAG TPA: SMP-30/gluconolactonase/LRE family protein [Verrucomicrobiota bacterium]|nr:SMP-30/gluconolactonase/LRE family protein [Verrucomicrobiota bacterium]HNU51657.1 SMP-30/gluconolactonase/LRE family protein [Verrucomicrobiota bacterium]